MTVHCIAPPNAKWLQCPACMCYRLVLNRGEPRPCECGGQRKKRAGNGVVREFDYRSIQGTKFQTYAEVKAYLAQPRLLCLICGKRYMKLGFHIATAHDMAVKDYNWQFGLPVTTSLICEESRDRLRAFAMKWDFPNRGRALDNLSNRWKGAGVGVKQAQRAPCTLELQREIARKKPRDGSRWVKEEK
jgi:hypothetical protein